MGWMNDPNAGKNGIWGDEPQDIIDEAVRKRLHDKSLDKVQMWPLVHKRLLIKALLSNKALKAKFDKPFLKYWSRKGTMAEYRSHIITALGGLK